jgi:hypothetical protein
MVPRSVGLREVKDDYGHYGVEWTINNGEGGGGGTGTGTPRTAETRVKFVCNSSDGEL